MVVVDQVQRSLSVLQAIPAVGPLVFSPVKIAVSTAQMVAGLAVGIFFGMLATSASIIGANRLGEGLGVIALAGFSESISGFGSLFYASANMATLGLLGLVVELSFRDIKPYGDIYAF